MLPFSTIRARGHIFQALKYRDFRLFWFGQLSSVAGFQMLLVAQGWLVYDLTGSKLQIGLVGLVASVPSILLTLFGGVVADRVDQRRLIMVVQSLSALVVAALATMTFLDLVRAWHVMAMAFLMGGLGAFDQPSRQAIFPRLIERRALMNAVGLNSIVWQGTRIVSPALAGVFIAWAGAAATFYLTAAAFMVFVLFLAAVRMPEIDRAHSANVLRDMLDGLAFVRDNNIFLFLLGMTFFNSFFGLSYVLLMPVFQKDILHVGPDGLGLLLAMSGLGGLIGTAIVMSLGEFRYKGLLLIGGAVAFGCFLVLFAYSQSFVASLLFMTLVGISSSVYMIASQSTLQMLVPDRFRGRVMGLWGITYNFAHLGGLQAGVMANYFGAPFAVALGGLAVITFAFLGGARNTRIRRLGAQE